MILKYSRSTDHRNIATCELRWVNNPPFSKRTHWPKEQAAGPGRLAGLGRLAGRPAGLAGIVKLGDIVVHAVGNVFLLARGCPSIILPGSCTS